MGAVTYARVKSGIIKVPGVPQLGPELAIGLKGTAQILGMKLEGPCLAIEVRVGPTGKSTVIKEPLVNLTSILEVPEAKVEKDSKAESTN